MKHCLIALLLATSLAHADTVSDLRAEIAQRRAVIAQMRLEGRPTGRFEMTVMRLERELDRQLLVDQMLTTTGN